MQHLELLKFVPLVTWLIFLQPSAADVEPQSSQLNMIFSVWTGFNVSSIRSVFIVGLPHCSTQMFLLKQQSTFFFFFFIDLLDGTIKTPFLTHSFLTFLKQPFHCYILEMQRGKNVCFFMSIFLLRWNNERKCRQISLTSRKMQRRLQVANINQTGCYYYAAKLNLLNE